VTALDNHVCTFNDEHNNNKHAFTNINDNIVKHLLDSPCTPYIYMEALCHDYNNGILSAVAYMQDLQDFTEDCLQEHQEQKVDWRAKI
jgi:hypothetical protein